MTGAASKVRLAPGVRLHHDRVRDRTVVLAPERIWEANGPALEVLRLCDGQRTLGSIAAQLAARHRASEDQVLTDIINLIEELALARMVDT